VVLYARVEGPYNNDASWEALPYIPSMFRGGAEMSQIADFIAYSPDGQIALIAEAKGRRNTSRSWATQLRRNLLAHGTVPTSRFFLLALPDRLYLWKDAGNASELVEPTYEIDAAPFFQPYYEAARVSPDQLTGQSFELIVTSWLRELVRSGMPADVPEPQQQLLLESGLLDALKGGSVAVEVSA
jgi:hypothetical protein